MRICSFGASSVWEANTTLAGPVERPSCAQEAINPFNKHHPNSLSVYMQT